MLPLNGPFLLLPAPQFNPPTARAHLSFLGAGSLLSGNDTVATVALSFAAGQSFENPPGRCSRLQRPFLIALERSERAGGDSGFRLLAGWANLLAAETRLGSGWSGAA
jgi:hypothetical protein